MDCVSLRIFFEAPFWVGLYERQDGNRYSICKITFGAEPKDYEVWEYLLKNWHQFSFSPFFNSAHSASHKVNPKRMQRAVRQQLSSVGEVGTKAQQALKLQQEAGKLARRARSRQQREAEAQRQYALHQEKRREKHRGH